MGDHADYLTDEQGDLYYDHLAGHVSFPGDYCPYCEEEYRAKEKKEKQSNNKLTGAPRQARR